MADYTEPDYVDRRLRYFDGQFLREQDFIDEQRYHLDRERRLARTAHTPGVIEGLAVTPVPNAPKVTVAPGTTLDGHGRLLVRVETGDPVDLTDLVNRDDDVTVVVGLTYVEAESDAPQGGASPRWREAPKVTVFLEGAQDAPPPDVTPRLARVTLHPAGTAAVDADGVAPRSGLAVRGALSVAGPASFRGGVDGGASDDGSPSPVRARAGLQVTGVPAFDSSVRLDVTNGSADFGRANLVITGRFQDGNDGWTFGTAARNALVFARNAAEHGQAVGAVGDDEVSLQLEGNSRSLGILTRDRGNEPALLVAQDGTVQVGTDGQAGTLDVAGNLTVRGGAALARQGQWTAEVLRLGRLVRLQITIAPGSDSNVVVVNPGLPAIGLFQVVVPDGTAGQWFGRYTTYDPQQGVQGVTLVLTPGGTMIGDAAQTNPTGSFSSAVLVVELHRILGVG
ncbi:MAG: hypothetical protein ACXVGD_06930 [Blastococcus sp.]